MPEHLQRVRGGRREGAGRKTLGTNREQAGSSPRLTVTFPAASYAWLEQEAARCGLPLREVVRRLVAQAAAAR